MQKLCLLVLLVAGTVAKSPLDKAAKAGIEILEASKLPGTVRQCNCLEEKSCTDDTVNQILQCTAGCYGAFGKVTPNPQALKQCVDQKTPVLNTFLTCMMEEGKTCNMNPNQPQVSHYDFGKAIALGTQKVQQNKAEILSSGMMKNIKEVGNAGLDFGGCVSSCYVAKNKGGFCYDKKGCSPLFEEKKARKALKNCLKKLNWKSHAGELCDCALKAGVSSLQKFCPILRLMSSP